MINKKLLIELHRKELGFKRGSSGSKYKQVKCLSHELRDLNKRM